MAGVVAPPAGMLGSLRETAEMIKIQHTVFALPFAIIALVTAAGGGWPEPRVWGWVLVAMVAARTSAMAFNRLADHDVDTLNPRTSQRALPAGRLTRTFVWVVTGCSVAVFLIAAGALNRLCLALAVPTLAILLGYSYSKRFTALSHLWLGLALAIAPAGAWIAVTGRLGWPPVVLGGAVMVWVGGFDVLYSLQDVAFDRLHDLHSMPAWLGGGRARQVSRLLHGIAIVAFFAFAMVAGGGVLRFAAVMAAAVLLAWQHWILRNGDLSRLNAAFFTANGVLSILMCVLFLFAKMRG